MNILTKIRNFIMNSFKSGGESDDEIISKIINTINSKKYPSLDVGINFKTYKVPIQKYVYVYYQTILYMMDAFPFEFPTFLEVILKWVSSEFVEWNVNKCTGVVEAYTDTKSVIIDYSDEGPIEHYAEYLKDIFQKGCVYYFSTLSVISGKNGHQNALFAFKHENQVFIALYEPHGYAKPSSKGDSFDMILDNVVKAFNDSGIKAVKIPRIDVSCPLGLQTSAKDKTGYCVMFSHFWLFCILILLSMKGGSKNLSEGNEKDILYTINNLETSILSNRQLQDPKQLQQLIMNFAVLLINEYSSQISTHIYYKDFMDVFEIKMKNVMKKRGENEGEESEYKGEEKGSSKRYTRSVYDVASIDKRYDGEGCLRDEQCFSHCCKNKRCMGVEHCMGGGGDEETDDEKI
jgi:hypothetical protein